MSHSMRNTGDGEPNRAQSQTSRPRRRHRLARFLWALIILLVIILGVTLWGIHRLGVTNSSLSGISGQLHSQSTKLSSINGRLHQLLTTMRAGFDKIGQDLSTLIRIAHRHL